MSKTGAKSGIQQSGSILDLMGKYAGLTAREQTVAKLAADGLSNKAIARELGLREGTVKVHMHSIFQKMRITTRMALIAVTEITSSPPTAIAA